MLLGTNPFFRWSYVTSQWSQIQSDLVQHIELSLIAVAIGTVISIPLAVLAWRYRIVRTPVFGLASSLYIIPSLALFVILEPIFGAYSFTTAEFALVGYTLLILIWNTVAGLDAVPDDAREAATALGYSRRAALVRVDLPLALPYIFAGSARGHGDRDRTGDRHGADRPRGSGPADHVRLQRQLQHAHHRRTGPLDRPGRGGRSPPGRGREDCSCPGRAPAAERRRSADVSFLAHVFGWFTTSGNWTGPQGIPTLFWNQIKLSVAVVATAIVLGGGLGVVLGHTGRGGLVAVNAGNAFRAVPTLALLTLLAIQPAISLKWGGFLAAWLALTALAIPPILTNTYVGMREVDADVRDAAKAMGLTGGQVLRTVEAPLALPFVMAGVRTATIEVVATSTLAAYVSYADLGTPVIAGLNTNDTVVAFSGAILVAVLAGLVTLVLTLLTRALTPLPLRRHLRRGPLAGSRDRRPRNLTCKSLWDKSGFRNPDGLVTVSSPKVRLNPDMKKVLPMRLTRFLTAGILTALAATLAIPAVTAGASTNASSKPTIVIGSTNFEEQAIVSNIWADVLKKAGYNVTVKPALGTRAIVVPAIEKGQIDLEPDYAASLLGFLHGGNPQAAGDNITTAIPADQKALAKLRRHRAARLQGTRHERVRRDQGDRFQGSPHHHLEPQALRLEAHPGRPAGVPDLRRLRAGPEEDLRPHLRRLQVPRRSRPAQRGRAQERRGAGGRAVLQ